MSVTHLFVSALPDGSDTTIVRPSNWNEAHVVSITNDDVAAGAAIAQSKLNIANAATGVTGLLTGADWDTFNDKQAAITFPLSPTLGGTGVNNGAFELTVPATGMAALGSGIVPGTSPGGGALYYVPLWNTANTLAYDTSVALGTYFGDPTFFVPSLNVSGGSFRMTNATSAIFSSTVSNMYFRAPAAKALVFADNNAVPISIGAGEGRVVIGPNYGSNPAAGTLGFWKGTATTNAVLEVARITADVSTASTGGANGFGAGFGFYAETATNLTGQQQGLISTSWIDATNASRKAKMSLSAYDTAARLGIEIEASGTEPLLGFYGVTPIARAVLATGAGATVDQVITALQNLGLVKQA